MIALQDHWTAAWDFASRAHRTQALPGTNLPYLVHLGTVSMEILIAHQELPFQRPALAVQCALLHDTLEDTATSKSELLAIFGQEVTFGVLALTKNPSVPSGERMADSVHRIRLQPSEVWAVKMADRIANLGPPPQYWSMDKIASYRTEAQFILEALRAAHAPLAARLAMRIAEYPPNVATRHG